MEKVVPRASPVVLYIKCHETGSFDRSSSTYLPNRLVEAAFGELGPSTTGNKLLSYAGCPSFHEVIDVLGELSFEFGCIEHPNVHDAFEVSVERWTNASSRHVVSSCPDQMWTGKNKGII